MRKNHLLAGLVLLSAVLLTAHAGTIGLGSGNPYAGNQPLVGQNGGRPNEGAVRNEGQGQGQGLARDVATAYGVAVGGANARSDLGNGHSGQAENTGHQGIVADNRPIAAPVVDNRNNNYAGSGRQDNNNNGNYAGVRRQENGNRPVAVPVVPIVPVVPVVPVDNRNNYPGGRPDNNNNGYPGSRPDNRPNPPIVYPNPPIVYPNPPIVYPNPPIVYPNPPVVYPTPIPSPNPSSNYLNFDGRYSLSLPNCDLEINSNSFIFRDCNTWQVPYTISNNRWNFQQARSTTSASCGYDRSSVFLRLLSRIVSHSIRDGSIDFFGNQNEHLFSANFQKYYSQANRYFGSISLGYYSAQLPSYNVEVNNNQLWVQGCDKDPIPFQRNSYDGVNFNGHNWSYTSNSYGQGCSVDQRQVFQDVFQNCQQVKPYSENDRKGYSFYDSRGNSLVNCQASSWK